MSDEAEESKCVPPELNDWPIWALDVRERFVEKAFLGLDHSSLDRAEAWQVVDSATLLVRALYPGLP
jgi:hypothetical protein